MSDDFLKQLENNTSNLYVSDSLKDKVNFNESSTTDVFYVKINGHNYDLHKYKNTGDLVTFKFFLEKPQFKKIILSSFSDLDLYVDNIKARTITVDKENIRIKIKKLKNIYKVKLSLKRNLNKKEIL